MGNNESAYRREINNMIERCWNSNPALNSSKTKGFRKRKLRGHASTFTERTLVERANGSKFLCVHMSDDMSRTQHKDAFRKKTHQCLYFVRQLMRFSMWATTWSRMKAAAESSRYWPSRVLTFLPSK